MNAVIFDIDGVLCDSEPFICEAAIRMFEVRYHTKVLPDDFLPFVGAGEKRYLGGVAEKYGIKLDLDRDKVFTYEMYLEAIRGRLQPLPGVHDFIAKCRKRNLKLAVASSADKMKVDGNLRELRLADGTFDACVNGSEVAKTKPHPEIFLTAAARLGVNAAECLVVEDAVNGIKAGKAAGAKCLGITSSFDAATLKSAGADWTAPNLANPPAGIWG
jgi:beta-phosphoglucomutase